MLGTVRTFHDKRGYGFITGDDGQDYFVHHTGIDAQGYRSLSANQRVDFQSITQEDNRFRAEWVLVIDE